jgi:hypothetical protein
MLTSCGLCVPTPIGSAGSAFSHRRVIAPCHLCPFSVRVAGLQPRTRVRARPPAAAQEAK